MSGTRRILLVAVLSLGLLALLLLLVAVGNFFEAQRPDTIDFREVTLATPPPPPPPPPDSNSDAPTAPVDLSAATAESPVLMLNMDLQVELPKGRLLTNESGWGNAGGDGIGLEIDWSGFSLAELDGYPVVIQAPVFPFPDDFVERSIKEIEVRLHILIDETGRAYLMRVVEAPDSSINDELDEFVQGVRFTPPTLSGVVVKAEFVWPVIFRSQ